MSSGISQNAGGVYVHAAAWGTETFEDFLKKLRNFPGITPLDVAAVQHVQGLAVTK
jgi:hypothetical protein